MDLFVFDPTSVATAFHGLPDLSISVTRGGTAATVQCVGDIDLGVAQRVVEAIEFAGDDDAVREVGVDVSGVSFCSVGGLRALLRAGADLRKHGKRFRLVTTDHSAVARVLALTQLEVPGD
jgi:anti-anti-sigma factor